MHAGRQKMTVQRRRRDSYKKAIVDILAVDAEAPLSSISEQLTAMFPNITPPGFEGAVMQVWIGDQVEAYRRTHEQTSGGQSQSSSLDHQRLQLITHSYLENH